MIKNLKQRVATAVVNVDKIFAGAALRRNALREVSSGTRNVSYLDLRV